MSLCLVACAGSPQVRETVARPRVASSLAEAQPWPEDAFKSKSKKSAAAAAPSKSASLASPKKTTPEPQRDAKIAARIEVEEDAQQDFSGVDVGAPTDADNNDGPREVVVQGIEGTTSEFDVRTTLDNRSVDFDRCHDRMGGGGGRIAYRIHIEADGDVGGVRVRPMRSRNRKLVDCYTEVVASSHFPRPHGGYADVKWTTKVGRSKKRTTDIYDRPHRWDTPSGSRAAK